MTELVLLLGKLAVVPLLIVLLGILPLRQTKAASAVVAEILAHGFAWAAIWFGLYFWIPKLRNIFEDFAIELPEFTIWVLGLSDIFVRSWFIISALFFSIVIIDAYVLFTLWERTAKFSVRSAWSVSMTALPLVIVVFGEVAMSFPLVKLFNSLS